MLQPIPNYPGYLADEGGNIWSIKKGRWGFNPDKPKKLTIFENPVTGYLQCTIWQNKRQTTGRVNVLVLLAFSGEPPTPKHECCHNDGNRHNNHPKNLRWDTRKNNHADKIKHGTHLCGENIPGAKLTRGNVFEILKLVADGVTQKEIAARFKVNPYQVYAIVKGKTWRHLTGITNIERVVV